MRRLVATLLRKLTADPLALALEEIVRLRREPGRTSADVEALDAMEDAIFAWLDQGTPRSYGEEAA